MSETTKDGVERILSAEDLSHFNWFEDRDLRADEVGIVRLGESWRVYSTDERANPIYDVRHADEDGALADFLKKLRATNRYFALRKNRLGQEFDASDGHS
jgi:hypothetical protein